MPPSGLPLVSLTKHTGPAARDTSGTTTSNVCAKVVLVRWQPVGPETGWGSAG
jgi:hypothetical protein